MTDLQRLTGELDGYDLVLANPLFNYGEVQDYGAYAAQWRAFMERGGAIVLTDCNYAPCVDWLGKIGETFQANTESCSPQTPATESTPTHPLHFFPNQLEAYNMWAHLILPGKGWEVISRCGDGHPIAAVQWLGRGLIFITSLWPLGPEDLENIWANLNLRRLGFAATQFQMPRLTVGPGALHLGLKSLADSPLSATLHLEVEPEGGAPPRFVKEETFTPGQERTLHLAYHLSVRGKLIARLWLAVGDETAAVVERRVVSPQLLNLRMRAPVYGGLVPLSRWSGKASVGVELVPDTEDVSALSLRLEVLDALGNKLLEHSQASLSAIRFDIPIALPAVSPGQYSVYAEVLEGSRTLARQEVAFTVLEDLPSQVVIDYNLNTIVNGKPFFPIGFYHVRLDDLPEVAALGINTVQGWGGHIPSASEFLDTAHRYGLMVLLEMGGFFGERLDTAGIEEHIRALKDHPALLAWYVKDEPPPQLHETVRQATELYHRLDPNHPTYLVSVYPREFPAQAELADILAVDPYPLPYRPTSLVAEWADLAWKGTKGEKPVWLIPQAHDQTSYDAEFPDRGANPPTPAQERCMTYLALVHGAKGIIWYTWDDGPNMGVKYHPPLREEIRKLCSQMSALSGALLSNKKRQFTAAGGKVHGVVCGSGKDRYLILVNVADEPVEAILEVVDTTAADRLTPAFGETKPELRGSQLAFPFAPYEVKVYRLAELTPPQPSATGAPS